MSLSLTLQLVVLLAHDIPQLATYIGCIAITPLTSFLITWFYERLPMPSRRSQTRALSSLLTEVFSGICLVQAFATKIRNQICLCFEAKRNCCLLSGGGGQQSKGVVMGAE